MSVRVNRRSGLLYVVTTKKDIVMLKEYLNYIQTIKEIKPAAYPQSIQEGKPLVGKYNNIPDPLLKYLKGNKNKIKGMNKGFLKLEPNDCKNWKEYRTDVYECKVLHKFIKEYQIVMFAIDVGGNTYGYSFKNEMVYYYDHEMSNFPCLYLMDKKMYNIKSIGSNKSMGLYVKKNYTLLFFQYIFCGKSCCTRKLYY